MAYLPMNNRRGLHGLGGVESCGPQQVWDPNITYMGTKGQCMPRANYQASQLVNPNAYPGVVKDASAPSSASVFIGSLIGALAQPKPQQPVYAAPAPSSGISTGTIVVAGAAALALVLIATR